MIRVETEVIPPGTDDDEDDEEDTPSCRLSLSLLDVGNTHREASVQLFGVNSDNPERGAEAILSVALAAAQLRGPDHHSALMQRLVNFDGSTA